VGYSRGLQYIRAFVRLLGGGECGEGTRVAWGNATHLSSGCRDNLRERSCLNVAASDASLMLVLLLLLLPHCPSRCKYSTALHTPLLRPYLSRNFDTMSVRAAACLFPAAASLSVQSRSVAMCREVRCECECECEREVRKSYNCYYCYHICCLWS
jgi:hypothetical protein